MSRRIALRTSSFIGLVWPFALAAHLIADSAVLRPGADTTLFEFNPNSNLGHQEDIPVGTGLKNGNRNRALFKFDVAARIPSNALVSSVTLTVRVTAAPGSAVNSKFDLHRLLLDWGEGTETGLQGAPAKAGEATWTARFSPNTKWSKPGATAPADFIAQPSATTLIAREGSYTFASTPNLVADVQNWLDNPTTNFGWILISQSESTPGTSRRIASREYANSQYVPMLGVQFSTRPRAATLKIESAERRGDQFRLLISSEAGKSCTVEFRDAFGATNLPAWSVLTNVTAVRTNWEVLDPISALSSRFYRVRTP